MLRISQILWSIWRSIFIVFGKGKRFISENPNEIFSLLLIRRGSEIWIYDEASLRSFNNFSKIGDHWLWLSSNGWGKKYFQKSWILYGIWILISARIHHPSQVPTIRFRASPVVTRLIKSKCVRKVDWKITLKFLGDIDCWGNLSLRRSMRAILIHRELLPHRNVDPRPDCEKHV